MNKLRPVRFAAQSWSALLLGIIGMSGMLAEQSVTAGELMYGCMTRPACGKVCKLVCETKTLTTTCYGCECDQICIPGPSQPGCKHCATNCCCGGSGCGCGNEPNCGAADCCDTCGSQRGPYCENHAPKCELCWRDWCVCGCAKPRTVKKLTKFEAQREICWYHWVVVDSCCCGCGCGDESGCGDDCGCVCKEAPESAQIGDVLELSADEQKQIASRIKATTDSGSLVLSSAGGQTNNNTQTKKQPSMASLFRLSEEE